MKKKKLAPPFKKILLTISLIIIFFLSATTTYFGLSISKIFVKSDSEILAGDQGPPPPVKDPTAKDTLDILLLGYGGEGHPGGMLTDVMMIVHIDPEERKAAFISIPRDLWVSIPVRSDQSQNRKINAAFAVGSDDRTYPLKEPQFKGEAGAGNLTKLVVKAATGITIDHFIAVNFSEFEEAIDVLGGIEVDVPVTFDDYFYPVKGLENETCGKSGTEIAELSANLSGFQLEKQFECRYEHLHFDEGLQEMDGVAVLKFVRSRHSEQHGGDFARSERQQVVLESARDKLISIGVIDDIPTFVDMFTDIIRTNLDIDAIKQIAQTYGSVSAYGVKNVGLTEDNVLVSTRSPDGQFILIPKAGEGIFSEIHSFIQEEIQF